MLADRWVEALKRPAKDVNGDSPKPSGTRSERAQMPSTLLQFRMVTMKVVIQDLVHPGSREKRVEDVAALQLVREKVAETGEISHQVVRIRAPGIFAPLFSSDRSNEDSRAWKPSVCSELGRSSSRR